MTSTRSTRGRCSSIGDALEPMDDVMQRLIAKYGKLGHAYEYLGVANGHWLAVPVGWGSAPLTPCARISLLKKFANIDVQAWYPAHQSTPEAAKDWTYDTQLKMAEASFKAGLSDRLRLRLQQHRRQPDLGSDVRRVRRRSGRWQEATSPSNPTT